MHATFRHIPKLSGNGQEDTGRKGHTIEMKNETSGTVLTTTQKLGVFNEGQEKYGGRNSGDKSERVEVRLEIAE
jgi:hypothetical protein